ncbi:cell adhesion molecule 4-like [Seriola aureovittata]|uniref:cell adhesion molecule 4-like n=1 Tax=Seriola aureovittata TaxID=2871759 RepID=UPI0024BE3045|nr:cell adhesion molecule 4-like [Seriola aureovittata]
MRTAWAFLLLLAGAVGQRVKYPPPVCAVKGSTVTLPCTFTPTMKIIRVVWCQNHLICYGVTPSVYDSDSKTNNPSDTRYKYLGDKTGNCTLQISNLQKRDEATFRFRMEADDSAGHWTGQSGVNVTVVDGSPMKITSSSEREVREGQSVTLLCTSTCTFQQLQVTWFRGDHPLPESGPALMLSPLTAEDSGNYTCGLKANQRTRSVAYVLQVEAADGGTTLDYLTIVRVLLVTAHTVLIVIVASIVIKRTCVCRRQSSR